jgi:phosphopantetheinyl transferase
MFCHDKSVSRQNKEKNVFIFMYVVRESIVKARGEKSCRNFDGFMFSDPLNPKVFWGVCVSVYIMCASLMPERLDEFYSYLIFDNLSTISWSPVNMNIIAPKIRDFQMKPQNLKLFSRTWIRMVELLHFSTK